MLLFVFYSYAISTINLTFILYLYILMFYLFIIFSCLNTYKQYLHICTIQPLHLKMNYNHYYIDTGLNISLKKNVTMFDSII